jgi:DNA-binding MarR family transcriptional regulator
MAHAQSFTVQPSALPSGPKEAVMTLAASSSSTTAAALGEQVLRLHRAFNGMRQQLVGKSPTSGDGVEWAAYGLLFQLVGTGPQRSSTLAETVCVDPSTVSRQVAQLVKAGLAERQSDPEDGRASLLVATEAGRAVYQAKQEHRERMFARVLDGWSPADVETLTALLTRLNDSFTEQRSALTAHAVPVSPHEQTNENSEEPA